MGSSEKHFTDNANSDTKCGKLKCSGYCRSVVKITYPWSGDRLELGYEKTVRENAYARLRVRIKTFFDTQYGN